MIIHLVDTEVNWLIIEEESNKIKPCTKANFFYTHLTLVLWSPRLLFCSFLVSPLTKRNKSKFNNSAENVFRNPSSFRLYFPLKSLKISFSGTLKFDCALVDLKISRMRSYVWLGLFYEVDVQLRDTLRVWIGQVDVYL